VPENTNNKWTPEEEALLKSLIEANTSIHLIAAKLKRSVGAIRAPRERTAHTDETGTGRAEGEEMSKSQLLRPWTAKDDDRLRALAAAGETSTEISKQLGRSPSAVRRRALQLSIVFANSLKTVWLKAKK
jgi:hypothetical protein